jgi:D-3-phosphoglycerate dehydrogenase
MLIHSFLSTMTSNVCHCLCVSFLLIIMKTAGTKQRGSKKIRKPHDIKPSLPSHFQMYTHSSPGGNTIAACELTCGLILALSRHVASACSSLKNGVWDRKSFTGNEVYGKTLAIIGLGRIGREVGSRMRSFGMKTIGYDPLVPPEVSATFGIEGLTLDQIWPIADYITVHVPLLPETRNLLNEKTLSQCKKGVRIINVARGGIIDEAALLNSLQSGHCAGAALDVYEEEPPQNATLIGNRNVLCTPHLGASTKEAQVKVAEDVAEQLIQLKQGQSKVHGAVNPSVLK